MPIYRRCSICHNKVKAGVKCKCEIKQEKERYKQYKYKRLQDKEEFLRQKFYSNNVWLNLSEAIKKHYLGLCVMCWYKNLNQDSLYTHHIETIKDRFDLRLCEDNLIPL